MAFQNYIVLNGLRYKVAEDLYKPGHDVLRTHTIGLTALTIVQDFTVIDPATQLPRDPQTWEFRLRVFINDPYPDASYGIWDELLAAYRLGIVDFTEHDDTKQHEVLIDGPLFKVPQVAANIAGYCNGILFLDTLLTKVHR